MPFKISCKPDNVCLEALVSQKLFLICFYKYSSFLLWHPARLLGVGSAEPTSIPLSLSWTREGGSATFAIGLMMVSNRRGFFHPQIKYKIENNVTYFGKRILLEFICVFTSGRRSDSVLKSHWKFCVFVCSSRGVHVQPCQQIIWRTTQKTWGPECHHWVHCSFRIHGRCLTLHLSPVKSMLL